jgi:uncharacterized protein
MNCLMKLFLKANLMKNFIIILTLALAVGRSVFAQEVPYLTGRINDYANVISERAKNELENLLRQHENQTTNQLAVLIVPTLGNGSLEDFAERVFQTWKLGQQGKDNGALLLVAINDRKMRIEVGYGLEPYITDAISNRIIQNEIAPFFRRGDYQGGIRSGLTAIVSRLEGEELDTAADSRSRQRGSRGGSGYGFLLFLMLVFSLIAGTIIFKKNRRNAPRKSKSTGLPMRKLSEEDDDQYLDEGQRLEEKLGSVDYDVWISDEPGDIVTLPYKNFFSKYSACPKCGYRTYSKEHSRIVEKATYSREGKGERKYKCEFCKHTHLDYYRIPRLERRRSVVVVGGGFGGGFPGGRGGGFTGGGGFRGGGGFSGGGGASGGW